MSPISRWYPYGILLSHQFNNYNYSLHNNLNHTCYFIYCLSPLLFFVCLRVLLDYIFLASANLVFRPSGSSLPYVCVFSLTPSQVPIIFVFVLCLCVLLYPRPIGPLSLTYMPLSSSTSRLLIICVCIFSQCSLLEPVAIHSECFDSWRSGLVFAHHSLPLSFLMTNIIRHTQAMLRREVRCSREEQNRHE